VRHPPTTIGLLDLSKNEVVDALLYTGLTEEQIGIAQAEWEPVRKTSIERLLKEGHPLE